MANTELIRVEERPDGRLLFNVRVTGTAGRIELPIAIRDQGSNTSNETAVFQCALDFARELEAAFRLRLGVK
ncbi:hypothetical protein HJB77_22845 [Rhizobium lentis]|uniref:hypothetical protein n=1 Tax=Rhizobium lentis TaxID=1138194 RepID=UPI001C82D799|nr:hypothetical protein [Rhizobium lentis]MBX5179081.1 hypothetical protein [Rhizobium lentis]